MQHTLSSNRLHVIINYFGAEISSIKDNSGIEYTWQADPEVWPRHAPVLFPIVGKLKNNTFIFQEKKYGLGQHGFARDLNFQLIHSDTKHCVFELKSTNETREKFPFDFVFRICYQLEASTLTTRYEVINPSEESIYFSVGAHPGFRCPLFPGEKFEDYYLEFEKDSFELAELSDGLRMKTRKPLELINRRLVLSPELFYNDALVFEDHQINQVSLCSTKSKSKLTLDCSGWPYFGIWTKKNSKEFICLEPWFGIADSVEGANNIESKDGIICLEKGKKFGCEFSITLG